MAFSKAQERTAWCSLAVMAGMLLLPPWVWRNSEGAVLVADGTPYYDWLWIVPGHVRVPGEGVWHGAIWWPRVFGQWLVVAIGMLLLLFLRERRERPLAPTPQRA
ncbi:MAG: hypothetical protein R3F29_14620 [Planctomycetota bacterium]